MTTGGAETMDGVEVGIDSAGEHDGVGIVILGGSGKGTPANMQASSSCLRRRL